MCQINIFCDIADDIRSKSYHQKLTEKYSFINIYIFLVSFIFYIKNVKKKTVYFEKYFHWMQDYLKKIIAHYIYWDYYLNIFTGKLIYNL